MDRCIDDSHASKSVNGSCAWLAILLYEFTEKHAHLNVNVEIPLDRGNEVIKFSYFACLLVSWIMCLLSKCQLRTAPWLGLRWIQKRCAWCLVSTGIWHSRLGCIIHQCAMSSGSIASTDHWCLLYKHNGVLGGVHASTYLHTRSVFIFMSVVNLHDMSLLCGPHLNHLSGNKWG